MFYLQGLLVWYFCYVMEEILEDECDEEIIDVFFDDYCNDVVWFIVVY